MVRFNCIDNDAKKKERENKMKYCPQCGRALADEAVVCVGCGCSVAPMTRAGAGQTDQTDAPNTGWAVLGFFIPIAGLILYVMNKDTMPLKAKSAGKGALIGFIVSTVLSIVLRVVSNLLLSGM